MLDTHPSSIMYDDCHNYVVVVMFVQDKGREYQTRHVGVHQLFRKQRDILPYARDYAKR